MEITKKLKVAPDDQCIVLNYKKRPADWETGKVMDVQIHVNRNHHIHTHYRVKLDRLSNAGNMIIIHVGNAGIKAVTPTDKNTN